MIGLLFCFDWGGGGYPLVDGLAVDSGAEIGSIIGFSDGILDGKLEGSSLGEWIVGA